MPPRNGMRWAAAANTARQNNRVHAFLALDARKVSDPSSTPARSCDAPAALAEVRRRSRRGRLEIPGLHMAVLWQLRTFARKTRDPRLLALDLI